MYPGRNPHTGSQRGPPASFRPTFVNSHHSSRGGPSRGPQSSQRPQGGQSTVVRPGQPHYFNTHIDRQLNQVISPMCRCQNPNSHGDAWTTIKREGRDHNYKTILWEELANKILDHVGTATVSHAQARALWPTFLCAEDAYGREMFERDTERAISLGAVVRIGPPARRITHFNGDGHAQRVIGENGLQTDITDRGRGR
ncbi:hypothetical protein FB567DRAFT_610204 [Paraphoma chrysanthemicola]|uniref:Uncharacterized protein n=1 Tax=Paraphoma chrysanthemicola TaxID=798071 RepID=A0A8K0W4E2_9PLEO|nr:hypothetical protein FB567DRAFT_610204 [Paraphoma chrysanthemicola]